MAMAPVITVDGPSGSGKGTVSRRLASRLSWHLLDSGALYRLVGLVTQRHGLEPDDPGQLAAAEDLARQLDVTFEMDANGGERVLLAGEDVTAEVRTERCGARASRYAVIPAVRTALLDLQHRFRKPPGLIADGRDMGTVVFPDAELKIFLTASAEERARRRYTQLRDMGLSANLDRIFSEIRRRDERDSTRQHAPLKPADDAILVDSTHRSVGQVVDEVTALAQGRHLLP